MNTSLDFSSGPTISPDWTPSKGMDLPLSSDALQERISMAAERRNALVTDLRRQVDSLMSVKDENFELRRKLADLQHKFDEQTKHIHSLEQEIQNKDAEKAAAMEVAEQAKKMMKDYEDTLVESTLALHNSHMQQQQHESYVSTLAARNSELQRGHDSHHSSTQTSPTMNVNYRLHLARVKRAQANIDPDISSYTRPNDSLTEDLDDSSLLLASHNRSANANLNLSGSVLAHSALAKHSNECNRVEGRVYTELLADYDIQLREARDTITTLQQEVEQARSRARENELVVNLHETLSEQVERLTAEVVRIREEKLQIEEAFLEHTLQVEEEISNMNKSMTS